MKQLFLLLFIFFCFNISGDALYAQINDSIKTHHIREVSVTTSAKPSATLSSTPVQSLSISDINRIGIQSVSDAVRHFAGVVVKDYGGIGGFKTMSIRGNGAEHTAILYDGMAVSNAQSGQVDIGKFSLENIEMLSLSIGQSDNIFRTAKAMASVGALDIKTVTPNFDGKNYLIQAQVKSGSWGLFNPYLYYAQRVSNKFSLSIDGSWQRADGQYPFERKDVNQLVKGKRRDTDIDVKRTELNLFGNLTPTQKLSLKTYYYDSERGIPGGVIIQDGSILVDKNASQRLWDKIFFTQGKYTNSLSSKVDLDIQAKYTHTYTKFIDTNDKYKPTGKQEDRYNQNELYATGVVLYKLTKDLSFSLAEDFSFNTLNANYNEFPEPDRYTSLTSLSAKYENSRFTIIGNLLGTYITDNIKEGDTPKDKKKIAPAISISYKPLHSTNLRIRASYKDIFRAPTFNDMYYSRSGNIYLSPEKARQLNMGLTWSNNFSGVFNYFNITGDIYYNKVKDKIVIYPSAYNPRAVNLGEVEIKGFDLNTNANIAINSQIDLQLSASYSYQHAIDITDPTDKNYKDQIPYTPLHSGAASLSIENPWVNIGYSFIATGVTYGGSQNTDYNKIDGYMDHTISANRTFNLKSYSTRVQADITNLANKTYYIIKEYPMPGRGYRISLNVKF